jgi:hypothetical protein
MKPITWLRKFTDRGFRGYPLASLGFYGPDDRKASKVVLGKIDSQGAEPQLRRWIRETNDKELRYDVGLQKACAEEGIPKDGQARARLATRKAQSGSWQ